MTLRWMCPGFLLWLVTGGLPTLAQETAPALDALAAARQDNVHEFARAVARSHRHIGVYLLDREMEPQPYIDPTTLVVAPLPAEALALFTRSSAEYRADETQEGEIRIVPRAGSPCETLARNRRETFSGSGRAVEVMYQIYRKWARDRSLYLPPGLAGSTLGAVGVETRNDFDTYVVEVSISVRDSTLENAMSVLAKQIPGVGWSIREQRGLAEPDNPKRGCSVGLFTGTSWLQYDWVLPDPHIR